MLRLEERIRCTYFFMAPGLDPLSQTHVLNSAALCSKIVTKVIRVVWKSSQNETGRLMAVGGEQRREKIMVAITRDWKPK